MQNSRFLSVGQTLATSTEISNGSRFLARKNLSPGDWQFECGGCPLPSFAPTKFTTNLATTGPFQDSAPQAMGMMLTSITGLGTPVRRSRNDSNLSRGTYTPTARMDGRTINVTALAVARTEAELNKYLTWLAATLEKRLRDEDSLFIGECDSVSMWEVPACRLDGGLRITDRPDDGVAQISFSISSITPSLVELVSATSNATTPLKTGASAQQHYACCSVAQDPTGCAPFIPPLPTNQPGCFCEPWRVHRNFIHSGANFTSDRVINVTANAGVTPYENYEDLSGVQAVHPTSNLRIAVFDPAMVPGVEINFGQPGINQADPDAPANQWWCKALVCSALIGTIPVGSTLKLNGATGRNWLTLTNGRLYNIDSQVQSVGTTSLTAGLRIPLGEERIVLLEADAYNTASDSLFKVDFRRTTTALADMTR